MVAIFNKVFLRFLRAAYSIILITHSDLKTPVVTGGGIYGTVKKIDLASGIIEVKIADGVVIKVDKGYVYKDTASTPMQK